MVTTKTFYVRNLAAFKKEMGKLGVVENDPSFQGTTYDVQEDGSIWVGGYDASIVVYTPDDVEVDLTKIIQKHLAPGETAIIQEVGHEGLRGVTGQVHVIAPHRSEWRTLEGIAKELANLIWLIPSPPLRLLNTRRRRKRVKT